MDQMDLLSSSVVPARASPIGALNPWRPPAATSKFGAAWLPQGLAAWSGFKTTSTPFSTSAFWRTCWTPVMSNSASIATDSGSCRMALQLTAPSRLASCSVIMSSISSSTSQPTPRTSTPSRSSGCSSNRRYTLSTRTRQTRTSSGAPAGNLGQNWPRALQQPCWEYGQPLRGGDQAARRTYPVLNASGAALEGACKGPPLGKKPRQRPRVSQFQCRCGNAIQFSFVFVYQSSGRGDGRPRALGLGARSCGHFCGPVYWPGGFKLAAGGWGGQATRGKVDGCGLKGWCVG